MNAWEKVVLKHILADTDEAKETCLEWLAQVSSRDEAIDRFAEQLRVDIFKVCCGIEDLAGRRHHDDIMLIGQLLAEACQRINYRRIARAVMNRCLPLKPTVLVPAPSKN